MIRIGFFFLMLSAALPAAVAQEMVFMTDDDSVRLLRIPGGVAVVAGTEDARVQRVLTPPGASDVPDLREDDLILFVDGARIASAADLSDRYDAIPVGTEVKLGIQRGEEKLIRAFVRPEPLSPGSEEGGMRFEVSESDMEGIPGLMNPTFWKAGFVVGELDGAVVVENSLPLPHKPDALADLSQGDVIVSMNGIATTTAEAFTAAYDALEVGASVALDVERNGVASLVTFAKPDAPNMNLRFERN